MAISSRIPIVALVVSERVRQVLTSSSGEGSWDVHFAQSCEEARAVANQLTAAVILFDRNWPGTEWRAAVESLADSAHHACVILLSGVSDDYLFQEVIRRGGYDVLHKPLQADHAARVVKLACPIGTGRQSQ